MPSAANKKVKLDGSNGTPSKSASSEADSLPPIEPPYSAATTEEKSKWPGFVEVPSNPELFSVMVQEMGITGVTVEDVWSLDEALGCLEALPQPIYGLVFLFQPPESAGEEEQIAEEPSPVWFANQVYDNACCSLAFLNILMNRADVDLGPRLQAFKESTANMLPAERGLAFGKLGFVKSVHNSFAKKMEMLNIDHCLHMRMNEEHKASSAVGAKAKRKGRYVVDESHDVLHFHGYVPVGNEVWLLDGMHRTPKMIGKFSEGLPWTAIAAPLLDARMQSYAGQSIKFFVGALCRDPDSQARHDFAACEMMLSALQGQLSKQHETEGDSGTGKNGDVGPGRQTPPEPLRPIEPNNPISKPRGTSTNSEIVEDARRALEGGRADDILRARDALQRRLIDSGHAIMNQTDKFDMQKKQADEARHDFGPLIWTWMRMLAEQDESHAKQLIEKHS